MKSKNEKNESSALTKSSVWHRDCPSALLRVLAMALILVALAGSIFVSVKLAKASESPELVFPSKDSYEKSSSDKEALRDRVEGKGSVLAYLDDWDLPTFDRQKFSILEELVNKNSVYDQTDGRDIAEKTATLFLDYYYDDIDLNDKQAVTDALLHCYARSIGDDYAYYRTPDEYTEHNTEMDGAFYGIGVQVISDYIENTMKVVSVYEDSPAEKAGITTGDYIYAVEGITVTELKPDGAISMIRGKDGTDVHITIDRAGTKIDVTCTRAYIEEHNVTYSIEDGIGYIKIAGFKTNTLDQFKTAWFACKDANVTGIVFDLRNNPGGYLSSVVEILSYFVPDGTVVASFGDYSDPLYAKDYLQSDETLAVPCVVLCNENTASAGELFTSALRDYAGESFGLIEAETVGTTTFGKGIMQSTWEFTDESAITLTVAFYNPPTGVNYHGVGITPDHPVTEDPDTEADEQLAAAYLVLADMIAD